METNLVGIKMTEFNKGETVICWRDVKNDAGAYLDACMQDRESTPPPIELRNGDLFRNADLVLVHNQGFSFLRFITGMYWNHLFIIDQRIWKDWGILESIGKGPAPQLLSMYEGAEIAVYRYRDITHQQQMKVITNARAIGKFHYDFFIPFRVIRRVGIIKFFRMFIRLLFKFYPLEIPHDKDNYVVCTEYGQESYARSGIPIIEDKYLLLPDDVPNCPMLELIWRGEYAYYRRH